MEEFSESHLSTKKLSFESLKKINQHGIEYWSARELQPCLGYSQWRYFENAIKKAIESCKQSGNNPDHHFAGARKQIQLGKEVRAAITKIGVALPENIPPAEHIKKVKKRLKTSKPLVELDPKDAVGIVDPSS